MEPEVLVAAGHELRQIRDTFGFRLWEVERRTEEQFGREHRIQEATLSRIERAFIKKPPSLLDVAELGVVYQLPPRRFYELYHLPVVGQEPLTEAREMSQLRTTLYRLEAEFQRPDLVHDLLGRISYEANVALHRARTDDVRMESNE